MSFDARDAVRFADGDVHGLYNYSDDFYKSLGMTVWEYKMEQRI